MALMWRRLRNRRRPSVRRGALLCLAVFLLAIGAAAPARGQFIGFTSPQTITEIAFGGQTCAGVGAGVFFNVTNVGQSVHYVLYQTAGPIQSLAIEIQGSRDGTAGSFFIISDTANAVVAGGVTATIYLPIVRIAITACTGTGTISATYTGTSVANGQPQGIFTSSGTFNKDLAVGRPANANATFTVPLPNGGTGGAIYFTFSDGTCAASTLTFTAGPAAAQQITLLTATTLAAVATTQAFTIPAIPATVGVVTYTTGCGGSAATYDMSFSVGERIVTANVTANFTGGAVVVPAFSGFACQEQAAVDVTAVGPGTSVLVTSSGGGARIHVCHISFAADATTDINLVSGTGVACATGPTDITGPYQDVATFAMDWGDVSSVAAVADEDLCLEVSGATNLGGVIVFTRF